MAERRAGRKHLMAVNRGIKAAGLDEHGVDAMLVEFLRDAARQIDEKGMDGVTARLISAYLSGQKDLVRAAGRKPVAKAPQVPASVAVEAEPAPVVMTGPVAVEESKLERLRKKKQQHQRSA